MFCISLRKERSRIALYTSSFDETSSLGNSSSCDLNRVCWISRADPGNCDVKMSAKGECEEVVSRHRRRHHIGEFACNELLAEAQMLYYSRIHCQEDFQPLILLRR